MAQLMNFYGAIDISFQMRGAEFPVISSPVAVSWLWTVR